jgi:hypothetical protein
MLLNNDSYRISGGQKWEPDESNVVSVSEYVVLNITNTQNTKKIWKGYLETM